MGLAALILLAWIASLVVLLPADLGSLPLPLLALAVLIRTLLHTGLFIVAHDAMHGLLLTGRPQANHQLGQLALGLYGCLPYGACRANHIRHHQAPGSADDPDHRPDPESAGLRWYLHFLAGYLSGAQMLLLLGCWGLLIGVAAVGPGPGSVQSGLVHVFLFCTLPLLLSSLQLFVFGTYLPHRDPRGAGNRHHARSLELPEWLSLLACYHFGYHWEHHEFPALAWFQLPRQRAFALQRRNSSCPLAAPSAPH
ncbi:MAG: fatty acid desaturase [Cyanobacteria bacterium]|nr:fatty acid desaturase [Cyanobacteria bacterium bin.51]